jgi:hypothetical protein
VVALTDTIRSRLVLLVLPPHRARFRCAFAGAPMDRQRSGLSPSADGHAETNRRTQHEQHALERDKPAKRVAGPLHHGWTLTPDFIAGSMIEQGTWFGSTIGRPIGSERKLESGRDVDRCS